MSRVIFTHSNRFGLLVTPRSKPSSENELAEVSYVCSQPACHPTELQSPLHSKLQPSFHSSGLHRSRKCQWDMSVQIPECPSLSVILSFQDLRDQLSTYCPCVRLWHRRFLWTFLWISQCFLYSILYPSLLDHDLLCLPLPDDCFPVLLCALQPR